MRKFFRTLWRILIVAFIVIQFFPPAKNISSGKAENPIAKNFKVPPDVQNALETSCYDCHSNNTVYPWYTYVQPIGWWMHGHIDDGKKDLNFDTFSGYSLRRQYRKFEQIKDLVKKGEMPLPSYAFIHRKTILSVKQIEEIEKWCDEQASYMRATFPADSLKKK